MERLTSQNLMATGRRVTRWQLSAVKSYFPFLELPAELRNMVYLLSIGSFTSMERWFDRAYEKLVSERPRQHSPPTKKIPTIFLLNQQIFREASLLLRKGMQLHFNHGLLKLRTLNSVISANLLRQVSSINITDLGHPMIHDEILSISWNGYMRLLTQLGEVLAGGHNLKELLIDFKDERFKEHMTRCYEASYRCGFRDQMNDALQSLRKVRKVGKVIILGLNAREARELKWMMEKEPTVFMSLPRELRDMIYEDTMDISDISEALTKACAQHSTKNYPFQEPPPFPFPRRTTPHILRLNKRIFLEAMEVLRNKPVRITFTADHRIKDHVQIPSILPFVSRGALKHAKTIEIAMESWVWVYNIEDRLVKILAASKNLQSLHFSFRDSLKSSFTAMSSRHYPDLQIHRSLQKLTKIRGLKHASFSGDLPVVYTDALAQIMTSKPSVKDADLPKLKAITGDGETIDLNEEAEDEQ